MDFWIVGLLDFWIVGFLDFWIVGFLDCWIFGLFGLLDFWIVGFLDFGIVGFLDFWIIWISDVYKGKGKWMQCILTPGVPVRGRAVFRFLVPGLCVQSSLKNASLETVRKAGHDSLGLQRAPEVPQR